eukprot:10912748-Ditylum_brightwellii.AAC.1
MVDRGMEYAGWTITSTCRGRQRLRLRLSLFLEGCCIVEQGWQLRFVVIFVTLVFDEETDFSFLESVSNEDDDDAGAMASFSFMNASS